MIIIYFNFNVDKKSSLEYNNSDETPRTSRCKCSSLQMMWPSGGSFFVEEVSYEAY